MRARIASFGDFRCSNCHAIVSSAHLLSGVNHRNHCPYCLWSSHLDLFAAGDRLSACKAPMRPIGLTMKKSKNKYQHERRGELMLIHECVECKSLSINRIAADDDSGTILTVFQECFTLGHQMRIVCEEQGIFILSAKDSEVVHAHLYGRSNKIAVVRGR